MLTEFGDNSKHKKKETNKGNTLYNLEFLIKHEQLIL